MKNKDTEDSKSWQENVRSDSTCWEEIISLATKQTIKSKKNNAHLFLKWKRKKSSEIH